jgi:hypothetical protein
MTSLAKMWLHYVNAARAFAPTVPHRCLEVRYESLTAETERELRRICEFLALPFDSAMLAYHERTMERLHEHEGRSRDDGTLIVTKEQRLQQQFMTLRPPATERMHHWRKNMTAEERREFEASAGKLLEQLGYSVE